LAKQVKEGGEDSHFAILSHIKSKQNLRSSNNGFEGETAAIKNWSYWYSAEFLLGTPPQLRTLMVDTGSSWMWTLADECPDPTNSVCS